MTKTFAGCCKDSLISHSPHKVTEQSLSYKYEMWVAETCEFIVFYDFWEFHQIKLCFWVQIYQKLFMLPNARIHRWRPFNWVGFYYCLWTFHDINLTSSWSSINLFFISFLKIIRCLAKSFCPYFYELTSLQLATYKENTVGSMMFQLLFQIKSSWKAW